MTGQRKDALAKQQWAEEVFKQIEEKLSWVSEKNKEKIPYTTGADGSYDDRSDQAAFGEDYSRGKSWWTNGFWGGLLWQLYKATGKESYAQIARASEEKLDECFLQYEGIHHDVGFMWMPTAVADYRLTGEKKGKIRGLLAAQLLAGRFNPAGGFIRAWNDIPGEDTRGWAIIDCMMNISLLYWASEETGDPRYREIAMLHAQTAVKSFIREDGSTNHIVAFDPETGSLLRTYGGQGYKEGSVWTRGQAWAIYGFTISYLHTKKEEFLQMAQRAASYFIAHMPKDGIIPVDFLQPPLPALEDSCAGVIAASGLLSLAECVSSKEAEDYEEAAFRILKTIAEKRCSFGRECDAIVQKCTGSYHGGDHHITMVYADYFFLEAILKLTGKGFFLW